MASASDSTKENELQNFFANNNSELKNFENSISENNANKLIESNQQTNNGIFPGNELQPAQDTPHPESMPPRTYFGGGGGSAGGSAGSSGNSAGGSSAANSNSNSNNSAELTADEETNEKNENKEKETGNQTTDETGKDSGKENADEKILEQLIEEKIQPELKQEIEKALEEEPKKEIELLLMLDEEEKLSEIVELGETLGGKIIGKFSVGDIIVLNVPAEKIKEIIKEKTVTKAYPKKQVSIALNESAEQINAPVAWQAGFTGKQVKIAVIDTGINEQHEMLAGKVIASHSFIEEETATDLHGHGTHVAGIIAGKQANGSQLQGIAPEALLINAKALNSEGTGSNVSVIKAINYAAEQGANIINLSLTGNYHDSASPINKAIKEAVAQGITVIAAAGNCGTQCPSESCGLFRGIGVPADSEYAITVGAVNEENKHACFSSGENILGIGIKPDLVAPGVNIASAFANSSNSYKTLSGTSMSAPHITGLTALLLEAKPHLKPKQVKEILMQTALDLGEKGKDTEFGAGLANTSSVFDFNASLSPKIKSLQALPFEVEKNAFIDILLKAWDDKNISNAKGKVITPLHKEIELNFVKATNTTWIARFAETEILGKYYVFATASDEEGLTANEKTTFTVVKELKAPLMPIQKEPNTIESNYFGEETPIIEVDSSSITLDENKVSASSGILNNTCASATALGLIKAILGIERKMEDTLPSGDIDWYNAYVPQTTVVDITLHNPQDQDYAYGVYETCEVSLATPFGKEKNLLGYCNDKGSPTDKCRFKVTGNFYIKVYSHNGFYDSSAFYSIDIKQACASNQCTNYGWLTCHNPGQTCCKEDKEEFELPKQYYCNTNTLWTECRNDIHPPACTKKGNYYCVKEGKNWEWKACSNGCDYSTRRCKENSCVQDSWKCINDRKRRQYDKYCEVIDWERCRVSCNYATNTCSEEIPCSVNAPCPQPKTLTNECSVDGKKVMQTTQVYSCQNRICVSSIKTEEKVPCSGDNVCVDGRCVPPDCAANAGWKCNAKNRGEKYRGKLNSNCSWTKVRRCPYGCTYNSEGQAECVGFSCPANQCASEAEECYSTGELCCEEDNSDGRATTEFGQKYCQANAEWAKCTTEEHTACANKELTTVQGMNQMQTGAGRNAN